MRGYTQDKTAREKGPDRLQGILAAETKMQPWAGCLPLSGGMDDARPVLISPTHRAVTSSLITSHLHHPHLPPSWPETDERKGNPRKGPSVDSHDTTGYTTIALTLDPSPLEGVSCLFCSVQVPDRDSLDQTLVRLPGASLLLSPHLGPWPVFGSP